MTDLTDEFMTDLYQAVTGHVTADFDGFPADVKDMMRNNVQAVLEHHEAQQKAQQTEVEPQPLEGGPIAIRFEMTDRGFKHYEPIRTAYQHVVRIYESSAADAPHIWLAVNGPPAQGEKLGDAHVHMSFEQTDLVMATLMACKANHYQLAQDRNMASSDGEQPEP